MNSAADLTAAFNNNTVTKKVNGDTEIRCKKGYWSVTGPDEDEVLRQARWYFYQYWLDGDYKQEE